MPSQPLLDLDSLDPTNIVYDIETIRQSNAQRFEMEQLGGIIHFDRDRRAVAAFRDVRQDEWWVRGHIPGRPLFPGVLMIEAAAQMASFVIKYLIDDNRFVGLSGVEDVRFRGMVVPPCRLILVGVGEKLDRRRSVIATQAFVDGKMVFEGKIIGMFL